MLKSRPEDPLDLLVEKTVEIVETLETDETVDNFETAKQSLTRGKKAQSRRERETQKQFLPFREEKEKFEFPLTNFEKRKRN